MRQSWIWYLNIISTAQYPLKNVAVKKGDYITGGRVVYNSMEIILYMDFLHSVDGDYSLVSHLTLWNSQPGRETNEN